MAIKDRGVLHRRIAVVGIGAVFPGAKDLAGFWDTIRTARDCAREVPDGRWLLDRKDAWSKEIAPDRVNSTRGCFVEPFSVDPQGLDIDEEVLAGLDPLFHLLLQAGRQAYADAVTAGLDRKRAGVIIGNIVLPTDTASSIADEILGPAFASKFFNKSSPEQKETLRLNRYVAGLPAGVLAKALGLGGGSYTLDAACASSLYALNYAAAELLSWRADLMLTGGVSRPDCLYTQMGFSQLQAISASGRCSPFDGKADGLVVGEGAGIVVLKRLEDALRDGDHIYATIAGIGLSNDIGANLMSPDTEGQLRAMRAAYQQAGWAPQDVDLIECHGTGTPVGDAVEFNSLTALWGKEGLDGRKCIISSVKSNVGHLLTAAGAAGLIKTLLAMQHRTLPPTANFERAADRIDLHGSPFTVLSQTREWPTRSSESPRRAAVSAFGFGGINAHVLLEEWEGIAETALPRTQIQATPGPAIAIIGMEAQFGPWKSLAAFQQRVLGDDDDIEPILPENWWGVDNKGQCRGYLVNEVSVPVGRFRIPPAELKEMLPQQLLMLQVAANALEDAGLGELDEQQRTATGVFIGIGLDLNTTQFHFRWAMQNRARQWAKERGLKLTEEELRQWVQALRAAAGPPLTANRTMGALGGIVASRVARAFRIGGPAFTVSAEENSGLRALEAGVRALQRGELDTVITGAVDLAGDVRAVLAQGGNRPWSGSGEARPFSSAADGAVIGEGAVALILKRYEDALRDGNTIHAVVRGIGAAGGGGVDAIVPVEDAYRASLARACGDAGASPENIGFVEAHGSGHAAEDAMEARALADWLGKDRRKMPCALGSVKADIGHAGAAAGLASVVKAVLCLQQRCLPPLRNRQSPTPSWADGKNIYLPDSRHYWLHNRGEGQRRAAVASISIDGSCMHAILEEPAPESAYKLISSQRCYPNTMEPALFALYGATVPGLLGEIDRLALLVAEASDKDVHTLARVWRTAGCRDHSLCLLARDREQLPVLLSEAHQAVTQNRGMAGEGIFYNPQPLGKNGKLAFVYPGSGNHFHGMGRELAWRWPKVMEKLQGENESLADQFAMGRYWRPETSYPLSHEDLIFGQVWLGTLVTDVIGRFGVSPDAVIGYSLGETTGLFSTRTWTQRDEMLRRMRNTDLFTQQLAGPCESVRRAWNLPEDRTVDWLVGVVDRSAATVTKALMERQHVYLLIINTPDECVIGGESKAVLSLVKTLGCHFHPVQGVTTVHCEAALPVRGPYRELHLFETNPPPGITFYSGVLGRSYEVTRDSAADSITEQALRCFDYTSVINAAHEDGVRIFIEMGPGATCTRMIDRILEERPHLARAICVRGQDSVSNLIQVLAQLVAEGVPVDPGLLYEEDKVQVPEVRDTPLIRVKTGGLPFVVPQPPAGSTIIESSPLLPGRQNKDQKQPVIPSGGTATGSATILDPVLARMQATEAARADTHEVYLRVANGMSETLGQALDLQMRLLQSVHGVVLPADTVAPVSDAHVSFSSGNIPGQQFAALDRAQCLEFATGTIGKVLGATFADIDAHPTRVRLPDEPLMLVDRIIEVEGEPDSMQSGRVVTEHDVHAGAWYLDGGRIPVCIAVEAGQADLFLSGYLGIDHITRGLAVYRLLDARITFHGPLPGPGETIRYNIHIDQFFRQGDTWLFRFRFEGTVNGRPLLTMTDGCAGFFTQGELDAGRGIVLTELERRPVAGKQPDDWTDLVPMQVESYSDTQLASLRDGRLAECFGADFAHLRLTDPVGLPGGRMNLVHRVLMLDPEGGRYGLGQITGEADIRPDDWFLTCHFVDDRVMPGTLMYECCLHTLRIYLLRMGWVAEQGDVVYEPIPGVTSQLKCRGQVIETTRHVQYEITLKERGYENGTGAPYVLADALMYADGRAIVQMNNMSVRLGGLDRERVETLWRKQQTGTTASTARDKLPLFDSKSILAFAIGKPSAAFGDRYRVFDEERIIARLPGPPFQFLDRITEIKDCQPWQLKAGADITAKYDIPGDAWYFTSERQLQMPFSVLLEVALQPCGWLAAYLGSALASDTDLSFRNLGGKACRNLDVTADTGTLSTRVRMTNVSVSGGMIIQNFDFEVSCSRGIVYRGDTYFGFFSKQALANQVGLRDVKLYEPGEEECVRGRSFPYPDHAPYPDSMMRMIDEVALFDPQGGPHGLGFIRGRTRVDAGAWFFKAHFYQDPVWPGSLGLESFLQLLKVVAMARWKDGSDAADVRFESLACGQKHEWVYRGQILPADREVMVQAVITEVDDGNKMLRADGFLCVDGRIIYQMSDFTLRITG